MLPGIREALGANFTGAYLCGSLALGGFDPETSDVDLLVVTERAVSDDEMAALVAVHDLVPPMGNKFGMEYEVYYIDRAMLRRFAAGQAHLKAGPDERLHRTRTRPNWVLERWIVRERGVRLAGPEPASLIDPISPDALRRAAREELVVRTEIWSDGTWPLAELRHRGAQGFEVETVCRALCTVETGELASKRAAVEWALASLPEEWRPLIQFSQQYRNDRTQDDTRVEETLAFMRWAAERATQS